MALAEALNQEAKALQAAGATFIQFNEPAITLHKEDIGEFANVHEALVDGLNVETALTYFGDVEGIYTQLFELPFDVIGLDFCTNDKNDALVLGYPHEEARPRHRRRAQQ